MQPVYAEQVAGEVAAALEDLTPRQRRAVYLVDGLGLPRLEAAGVLGVAEGTLDAHRHRGMTKLRAKAGRLAEALLAEALTIAPVLSWQLLRLAARLRRRHNSPYWTLDSTPWIRGWMFPLPPGYMYEVIETRYEGTSYFMITIKVVPVDRFGDTGLI